MRVEVRGATELAASLDGAATALERLQATNGEAARLVAANAQTRAPRRSGALAASVQPFDITAKGAAIGSGVVYSGVQEYGWPARHIRAHRYLQGAAESTDVSAIYANYVDSVVRRVKGA